MASSYQQLKKEVESNYSAEKRDEIEKIWKLLGVGSINPKEAMQKISEKEIREEFEHVLHNEWVDIANSSIGYHGSGFREHEPSMENIPYQGYKLRISANPRDARKVASYVLPALIKKNIPHKVIEDIAHLAGLSESQRGKFITIYPRFDEDKADEISVIDYNKEGNKRRLHKFWKSGGAKNRVSINSNKENTETLIRSLIKILKSNDVLKGERTPETDVQIGNTRISYRYGVMEKKNGVFAEGGFLDGGKLVKLNGDVVEDNRSTNGNDNWRTLNGLEPLDPQI